MFLAERSFDTHPDLTQYTQQGIEKVTALFESAGVDAHSGLSDLGCFFPYPEDWDYPDSRSLILLSPTNGGAALCDLSPRNADHTNLRTIVLSGKGKGYMTTKPIRINAPIEEIDKDVLRRHFIDSRAVMHLRRSVRTHPAGFTVVEKAISVIDRLKPHAPPPSSPAYFSF